jgi:hypothetical protein
MVSGATRKPTTDPTIFGPYRSACASQLFQVLPDTPSYPPSSPVSRRSMPLRLARWCPHEELSLSGSGTRR